MLIDTARQALSAARRLALAASAVLLVACSAPAPRGGPDAPDGSGPGANPDGANVAGPFGHGTGVATGAGSDHSPPASIRACPA